MFILCVPVMHLLPNIHARDIMCNYAESDSGNLRTEIPGEHIRVNILVPISGCGDKPVNCGVQSLICRNHRYLLAA